MASCTGVGKLARLGPTGLGRCPDCNTVTPMPIMNFGAALAGVGTVSEHADER